MSKKKTGRVSEGGGILYARVNSVGDLWGLLLALIVQKASFRSRFLRKEDLEGNRRVGFEHGWTLHCL